eukprot:Nk52_evm4s62 gene=Nk52_evmTU4s62
MEKSSSQNLGGSPFPLGGQLSSPGLKRGPEGGSCGKSLNLVKTSLEKLAASKEKSMSYRNNEDEYEDIVEGELQGRLTSSTSSLSHGDLPSNFTPSPIAMNGNRRHVWSLSALNNLKSLDNSLKSYNDTKKKRGFSFHSMTRIFDSELKSFVNNIRKIIKQSITDQARYVEAFVPNLQLPDLGLGVKKKTSTSLRLALIDLWLSLLANVDSVLYIDREIYFKTILLIMKRKEFLCSMSDNESKRTLLMERYSIACLKTHDYIMSRMSKPFLYPHLSKFCSEALAINCATFSSHAKYISKILLAEVFKRDSVALKKAIFAELKRIAGPSLLSETLSDNHNLQEPEVNVIHPPSFEGEVSRKLYSSINSLAGECETSFCESMQGSLSQIHPGTGWTDRFTCPEDDGFFSSFITHYINRLHYVHNYYLFDGTNSKEREPVSYFNTKGCIDLIACFLKVAYLNPYMLTNMSSFEPAFRNCSKTALKALNIICNRGKKGKNIISVIIHCIFMRTNVYSVEAVASTLDFVKLLLENFHDSVGLIEPEHINVRFFIQGIRILLENEHHIVLMKSLSFIYQTYPLYSHLVQQHIADLVVVTHFKKFFLHWNSSVRSIYYYLLVYRFTSCQSLERLRLSLPTVADDSPAEFHPDNMEQNDCYEREALLSDSKGSMSSNEAGILSYALIEHINDIRSKFGSDSNTAEKQVRKLTSEEISAETLGNQFVYCGPSLGEYYRCISDCKDWLDQILLSDTPNCYDWPELNVVFAGMKAPS